MLGNILNGIPGVGHAKGLVHYATGDAYEGSRAMAAANRSTLVAAGGALGMAAGPAGAVAGAMAAGAAVDTMESLRNKQPTGVIKGVARVAEDLSEGKAPIVSLGVAVVLVGSDALGGLGGAGVAQAVNAVGTEAVKSGAKAIVVEAIKVGAKEAAVVTAQSSAARVVADKVGDLDDAISSPASKKPSGTGTGNAPSSTGTSSKTSSHTSSSGSQPPRDNGNNQKPNNSNETPKTILEMFLDLFGVDSLEDVVILGVYLFRGLVRGQKNALKKLINRLNAEGILAPVVKAVLELFATLGDVSFQNFLSLANFVATYVGEQVEWRVANDSTCVETLIQRVVNEATFIGNLIELYRKIRADIMSMGSICPNFRNVVSAVYHYYKHRRLPSGRVLTVSEYYSWIKWLLEKVKLLKEYQELIDRNHPRRELEHEIDVPQLGGTLRIVLKSVDGKVELASVYVVVKGDGNGCF